MNFHSLFLRILLGAVIPGVVGAAEPLRLLDPPFAREDCERYILGAKGRRWRKQTIAWLAGWPAIRLTATPHQPPARPEVTSEAFAVFAAPPGTTKAELHERWLEVNETNRRWHAAERRPPPPNVLTPLQKMVLNIVDPGQLEFDQITTKLIARNPRKLILKTRRGPDVIGTRVLDLRNLQLGYDGDPYYWVFEEWLRQAAGGDAAPIDLNSFLDARGVFVLRPRGLTNREMYFVLRVTAAENDDELGTIAIEAYVARSAHPERILPADLRAPGLGTGDGRRLKFTSTGITLSSKVE